MFSPVQKSSLPKFSKFCWKKLTLEPGSSSHHPAKYIGKIPFVLVQKDSHDRIEFWLQWPGSLAQGLPATGDPEALMKEQAENKQTRSWNTACVGKLGRARLEMINKHVYIYIHTYIKYNVYIKISWKASLSLTLSICNYTFCVQMVNPVLPGSAGAIVYCRVSPVHLSSKTAA